MATPLLGAKNYTVRRPGAGSYPDGDWLPGGDTVFDVRASIQPLTGRERAALPEGYRQTGRFKMYVGAESQELQTDTLATDQTPDVIEYRGRDYEITSVFNWTDHAVDGATTAHRKYLLVLIGVDEREP